MAQSRPLDHVRYSSVRIFDAEDDRAAIVAALDHVQRLVGQEIAAVPSHGSLFMAAQQHSRSMRENYSDPFSVIQ
jgi:hypothetical protein